MKKILIPFLFAAFGMAAIFLWLGGASQASARQSEDLQSFTVVVVLPPGEPAEAAIDTQMVLVELLEYLKQRGSISSFAPYYGLNQITVQGSPGARSYLASFPGVAILDPLPSLNQDLALNSQDGIDSLDAPGAITGVITDSVSHAPIEGIEVTVYYFDSFFWSPVQTVTTNVGGVYELAGLTPSSNYRVRFEDPLGRYVRQFYDNKLSLSAANNVSVISGQTTPNINAAMQGAGNISGTVKKSNGQGISDIVVNAYQLKTGIWTLVKFTVTNSSGFYTLTGLPAGQHRLRFSDSAPIPRYVTEYYPNHDLIELAEDVSVTAGVTTTGTDVTMGGWASISGAVTGAGGATNMTGIQVDVWGDILGQWTHEISGTATTAANGTYTSGFLGTRDYRLRFSDPYGMYTTEYYTNALTLETAASVPVNLGANTPGINAQLSLVLNAPITQTFGTGWYLVGWPVNLGNPDPETVFTPIESTLDIVWNYDACASGTDWTFYNPELPGGNTLGPLAPSLGYWVKHTGSADLTVLGQYSVDTTINLCTGWNLIGYPAARPRPVKDVLAPISGKYTLVYGYDGDDLADPWEKYDPAYTVGNDLTTLQPGRAYWINMSQDAILTIPAR